MEENIIEQVNEKYLETALPKNRRGGSNSGWQAEVPAWTFAF